MFSLFQVFKTLAGEKIYIARNNLLPLCIFLPRCWSNTRWKYTSISTWNKLQLATQHAKPLTSCSKSFKSAMNSISFSISFKLCYVNLYAENLLSKCICEVASCFPCSGHNTLHGHLINDRWSQYCFSSVLFPLPMLTPGDDSLLTKPLTRSHEMG